MGPSWPSRTGAPARKEAENCVKFCVLAGAKLQAPRSWDAHANEGDVSDDDDDDDELGTSQPLASFARCRQDALAAPLVRLDLFAIKAPEPADKIESVNSNGGGGGGRGGGNGTGSVRGQQQASQYSSALV